MFNHTVATFLDEKNVEGIFDLAINLINDGWTLANVSMNDEYDGELLVDKEFANKIKEIFMPHAKKGSDVINQHSSSSWRQIFDYLVGVK
jgi:hypothetical protein